MILLYFFMFASGGFNIEAWDPYQTLEHDSQVYLENVHEKFGCEICEKNKIEIPCINNLFTNGRSLFFIKFSLFS